MLMKMDFIKEFSNTYDGVKLVIKNTRKRSDNI